MPENYSIERLTQSGGNPAVTIERVKTITLDSTADTGDSTGIIPAGTALASVAAGWVVYDEAGGATGQDTADYITLERVDLHDASGTLVDKPVLVLEAGQVKASGCIEYGPVALAAAGQADLAKGGGGLGYITFV